MAEAGLAAEPDDLFVGGLVAVAALAVAADEDPPGGASMGVVVERADDRGCEATRAVLPPLRVTLRTRWPWP